ncbi:DUF58 domain-containing protein [Chloroflexus sp.]|uniref:DUF58 domain-containing protein n=1 Tax=Chloroflexus sp. TaxID=1904827 RepID=UPI002ADDF3DD|nr:DUF58 domain-containing protein [Chloroflexus sp.]
MAGPLLTTAFLRKLDRLALQTRRAMAGDLQGERRSPKRGSSVEFADFRPYTTGDDIRQIDWNLYARAERFYLKLFVAEEELNVHLLVDTSRSMAWGDPEKLHYACQIAATFGYIALNNLDRVNVTAFGGPPAAVSGIRGKRGAVTLFEFLQRLEAGSTTNLTQFCRNYLQTVRSAGPLLLCSDLFDPGWRDALRTLTARPFEITIMHILSPQEIDPPIEGDIRLVDSEGGPAVEISADLDVLQRYRDTLRDWQHEIETFCSGRGIRYVPVNTAVPIEEFVFAQLRRAGIVR